MDLPEGGRVLDASASARDTGESAP
jgi:hypothetical protein